MPQRKIGKWGAALKDVAAIAGLYTTAEIADAIGAGESTVRKWLYAETVPTFRLGYDSRLTTALRLPSRKTLDELPEYSRRVRAAASEGAAADSSIPLSTIIAALQVRGVEPKILDEVIGELAPKLRRPERNNHQ